MNLKTLYLSNSGRIRGQAHNQQAVRLSHATPRPQRQPALTLIQHYPMMILLLTQPRAKPILIDSLQGRGTKLLQDQVPSQQQRAVNRVERMTQLHRECMQWHVVRHGHDRHCAQIRHDRGRVNGLVDAGRGNVLYCAEKLRTEHLNKPRYNTGMSEFYVVQKPAGNLGDLSVPDGDHCRCVVCLHEDLDDAD